MLVTAPGTGTGALRFEDGLRNVQWSLLLFLAATLVLGQALISSGAAGWMVESALARLSSGPRISMLAATIVASVSLLSRAARRARRGSPPARLTAAAVGARTSSTRRVPQGLQLIT
ncbi:MAG: SLC13 family permease [Egibacteraceae bacterium]